MKPQFSLETFRFYLSGNPWLRLLLPFGTGIALALSLPRDCGFFYEEMYGLLVFLLLAYLLALYDRNGLGLKKWIPGSVGLLFLFCTGFQLARAKTSLHSPEHFSKHSWSALYVQVNSVPEKRGKYVRFEARVLMGRQTVTTKYVPGHAAVPGERTGPAAPTGKKTAHTASAGKGAARNAETKALPAIKRTKGRLLIYIAGEKGLAPRYGDELWVASAWQEVPPPRNPAAFDYKSYLLAKDIYHQTFLFSGQWLPSGRSSGNPLIKWAAALQKRCVDAFGRLFQNEEDAALLSAFVLGYRAGIDRDTMNAFADTGTIHILSVSGLHVAILYWLINFILRPLGSLRHGRALQLLLIVCGISLYALLTGLSPPVCRAACMIVLYAIAGFMGRQHKAENILALTAFLLLAADPLALADVGFQLSFLAVAGLIFFYPPLAEWYRPAACRLWHRFLKHLWSMSAVSLAAQMATFPLSVFYFHQFPVYFLPANLVLMPLASLILYGGILLLLISGTGPLALFFARQLSFLVAGMKSGMHFFSELPGAVLDGIWITAAECIGLHLLILAGAFFLLFRKAHCLAAALCISLLLICSFVLENYRQSRQRLLIYFHQNKRPAIGFLGGKSAVLLLDTPVKRQEYAYSIQPFLDRSGIDRTSTGTFESDLRNDFLAKRGPFIQFFNRRILLVDKNFKYPRAPGNVLPCDLLLITENSYLQMEKIKQAFHVKMLVSGAGVSKALDSYLEGYCRRQNIPFYSVRRSGAFIVRLHGTAGSKGKKGIENEL